MDINSQYDQLTYDEKLKFYSRNLSSGSTMSGKLEDKHGWRVIVPEYK